MWRSHIKEHNDAYLAVNEKFWSDIGVAITSATQHGVSRVAIIADMLTAANNIAAICEAEGEDMSALAGLL